MSDKFRVTCPKCGKDNTSISIAPILKINLEWTIDLEVKVTIICNHCKYTKESKELK